MGKPPDGLYAKYHVIRTDGRDKAGGDKTDARYFVLDYVHDQYARAALDAYADACELGLPRLAADLRAQLAETVGPPDPIDQRPTEVARAAEPCGCLAYDPVMNDHTWQEHTDCGASSITGEACGGCDACISAQVYHTVACRAAEPTEET